jgi:mono/diheme cytochrome c family protein
MGLNAAEKAEVRKLFARGAIVGPQTIVRTVGMNPAEMLAVVLMQHHDRDTLAWSDTPFFEIDVRDELGNPIPDPKVTSDPPPWWRVHKKNALFYNGMARGDHRGTMSAATSVCVDSVARAQEVDEMFKDINAFIESIRPPAYARPIDSALANVGKQVFERDCAMCHGHYDANEANETYPNLLIPLDVIGTDPVVANAGVVHTPELVDWYNASFYGLITPLEPDDPFPGYMPPPLDGIWATAPYLHNGSVPTIELLLNSGARPTYWKRADYDSTNFDEEALGWPWIEVETPQAEAPANEAKFIYDTTYWSQSNKGHRFGDHLSDDERRALIEYLKTL